MLNFVEDESLRMEIIHEDDESNAAKMSVQHLDGLHFELTANLEHDCTLLKRALANLQQRVQLRKINRQLARIQFEQLREKLDHFFAQQLDVQSEIQLELLSYLCNDINQLLQLIHESYEEQSQILLDSRNDFSNSQLDSHAKKKSSDQLSQIHKKSHPKLSQQNLTQEVEFSQQFGTNSNHKNQQASNINLVNTNVNYLNNTNQMHVKYAQSRFSSGDNINANQLNNLIIQENIIDSNKQQMNQQQDTQNAKFQIQQNQDKQNQGEIDSINVDMIESNTNICYEENIINLPKSIRIKQNSINYHQSPQQMLQNKDSGFNIDYGIKITQQLIIQNENQQLQILKDFKENKVIDISDQNQNNVKIIEKESYNQDTKYVQASNHMVQDNNYIQNSNAHYDLKEIKTILEAHYERIKQLFDDKLIDEVEEERIKLYNKIDELKNQNKLQFKADFNQMITNFEQKILKELKYYEDIYKQLILTTNYIYEKDGWKKEKNKNGIQVEYKMIPNSKLLALRLECINMEMSVKVLMSIVYEIDLYSLWFPFCKIGKNLKTVDKACKVVYLKMDVPLIADREIYIHGIGVNRLNKDGSIVVMARSIDKDNDIQKDLGVQVPETTKCVRVDLPFFTFIFKPINENRLTMYAVCNLDPHLKVPDSVLNLVTRKFAYYLFEKMIEQNKKFKGSKWESNMKNSPEFYEWIEKEYLSFFKRNPQLSQQYEQANQENKNKKKK